MIIGYIIICCIFIDVRVLGLIFYCLFFNSLKAQLSAGDLMFVGFNADGSDAFAVVTLVDVSANSTFYFSDNEWNGSPIGSGGAFVTLTEGEMTWQTGAAVINAGTIITFNEVGAASNPGFGSSIGSISGNINLNADDEVLYMYEGTDDETPTLFISAIANSGFNMGNGTLAGTGLTSGVNAIGISSGDDVLIYNGSTICATTLAFCAAQIADVSNWISEDGSGDQSNNSIAPDFPTDLPPTFTGSALPIELHSFGVRQIDGSAALIEWVTLSEINNDYFTVEKSMNLEDWEEVDVVSGAGNSLKITAYSTLDHLSYFGVSYYRLKQTDFDGKFSFSEIETITISSIANQAVYPNPTTGMVYFHNDLKPKSTIRVLSINGTDLTNRVSVGNSIGFKTIDLSTLSSGIYFLQVEGINYRIIKQ
jgi:hypothetical protein